MSKFKLNQRIEHVNSGGIYTIIDTPSPIKKLEATGESYYVYTLTRRPKNYEEFTRWVRCQSEIEDGRFIIHEFEEDRICEYCGEGSCDCDMV